MNIDMVIGMIIAFIGLMGLIVSCSILNYLADGKDHLDNHYDITQNEVVSQIENCHGVRYALQKWLVSNLNNSVQLKYEIAKIAKSVCVEKKKPRKKANE